MNLRTFWSLLRAELSATADSYIAERLPLPGPDSLAAVTPKPAAVEGEGTHPGDSGPPLAAVESQGADHHHRGFRWLNPRVCIECGGEVRR